ncbi:MAG: serine/threonine protein kinase [Planctomycetes bacterium]|nr:serine/threonine protein kinase [Planctomycetota bacterium]
MKDRSKPVLSKSGSDISGAIDDLSGLGADSMAATRARDEAVPDPFAAKAPERFGRYRLLSELGQGGMGKVYLAEDATLGRRVALKVILAGVAGVEGRERFLREARSMARLQHPHVLAVHDIGEEAGQAYYTMDYIEGESLDRALARGLDLPRGLRIVARVARAVAYAHESGVIHRDLKPANVLVDRAGEPRVMDFGLARLVEDAAPVLTKSSALLGTPAYMSPEQAARETREIDERSDVWSLGVILYEIATGKRPFDGNELQVLSRIVAEDPRPPRSFLPGLPRDVETIAQKALEKKKDRRYPTAAAFAEDIERFLAGQPILARPLSARERIWRWTRRHRLAVGVAGLLVLAVTGVAVARSLVESAGEESRVAATSEVRAEEQSRRVAEVARRVVELERRIEAARVEGAGLEAYDSLRMALGSIARDPDSSIPAATRERWEREISFGVGRGIVRAERTERFDEARELLEGSGDPEASWWRAELEWLDLPDSLRAWPDPREPAPLADAELRRAQECAERFAGFQDTHEVEAALCESRLLLHLANPAEAKRRLEPLAAGAADRAASDPGAAFDIYHGLVLAAALSVPPDLAAVERWFNRALVLWRNPDPPIEDRLLIFPVAHAAALPFWKDWLEKGEAGSIERVAAWLEPAYDVSNAGDWRANDAVDLPWMLGVALLVQGNAKEEEKAHASLADACGAGYVARREDRYEATPALRSDAKFQETLAGALSRKEKPR